MLHAWHEQEPLCQCFVCFLLPVSSGPSRLLAEHSRSGCLLSLHCCLTGYLAHAGIMLQHALPDAAEYKPVPAALLRGWMTGKVGV
jgi:hypothetical protein